ncbi:MAG TPA: DUF4365 domain-containing protein [Chitinophagales bacterium]|nr:DUF4365 domain-containing protein [Chitinophagales bacterium]
MPKQTRSQKTGTLGHSIVETQVKRSNLWIARNLTEDYGIDLELEFTPENVSGKFVKAQIKSHEHISSETDFISEKLGKSFLRYAYECRVPVILIVISVDDSKTWFIWLQKWVIESHNVSSIYDSSEKKKLTVRIPQSNDFVSGLEREIVSIATWENTTQLYIALRDLANLSLRLYDEPLSRLLFDYLGTCKSATISDPNYLDSIIERVIELGTSIWATHEGNKVSQMLYKFIREQGDRLNANHVSKLIVRGEDFSRTGLNALGILYDCYPKHTASLNLTKRFENLEDPRLYYYCTIRERYLGVKSPLWLSEKNDLTVGKFKCDLSSVNKSILDKWANRGDSVIFDYVYETK